MNGNNIAKSLMTISKAYHDLKGLGKLKLYADRISYDLKDSYLTEEQQVELYKRIIQDSTDIQEIAFFLCGIAKLEGKNLNISKIYNMAISIVHVLYAQEKSMYKVAAIFNCSQGVIHDIIYHSHVSKEVALGIVFMYEREKIINQGFELWERLRY